METSKARDRITKILWEQVRILIKPSKIASCGPSLYVAQQSSFVFIAYTSAFIIL